MLLLSPSGTGETPLALAVAVNAIRAGYTVRYQSIFDLSQDLAEAQATGRNRVSCDMLAES